MRAAVRMARSWSCRGGPAGGGPGGGGPADVSGRTLTATASDSMIPPQGQREGTGLIVDDEPQIRRVVRNALQGELARLVEAATGSEGIDLAAAEKPILVVLDLGLPDMPGIEVCREIRKWS